MKSGQKWSIRTSEYELSKLDFSQYDSNVHKYVNFFYVNVEVNYAMQKITNLILSTDWGLTPSSLQLVVSRWL